MKRRFIPIVLTAGMLLGSLTGCGAPKVTAESLLENAFGKDALTSIAATGSLTVNAESSLSFSADEEPTIIPITADIDMDIAATKDAIHTTDTATTSVFGMTSTDEGESYIDLTDAAVYAKNSELWTKSDLDEEANFSFDSITSFFSDAKDILLDLTLKEQEEEEDYTVTGILPVDKLPEDLVSTLEEALSDDEESFDPSTVQLDVVLTFDKDTCQLKTINISNTEHLIRNGVTYKVLRLSATINEINDVTVEIPQDVIESATTLTEE